MEKIKLTDNQENAVNELGNVVVSAGAGSGKTKVLSLRFAKLVETGNTNADRILTLTFMNKAAVEMRSRIFKQLAQDSLKNENAKNALKIFDKTHIQTLDSYFSEIVRSGAHFYGISPNFRVDNEKIESLVNIKALQFILTRNQNKALQSLTRNFSFSQIANDIFANSVLKYSSIVSKNDFVNSLKKQKAEIENAWQNSSSDVDSAITFLKTANLTGKSKGVEKINTLLSIQQIMNPLSSGILKSPFWETIENNFDETCKKIKEYILYLSKWNEANISKGKEIEDIMSKIFTINSSINKLIFISEYILNFQITLETMKLLDEFKNEVQNAKRTSGILTFKDISELAFDILKNHDEIRHLEQQRFDKIMIDEFQDNNALQCDTLFMLCDENEKFDENGKYIVPNFDESSENYIQNRLAKEKLFFVGDEKQGIYRFRGADVSVFRDLQKHLRKDKFNDGTNEDKNYIYLETNFRSKPNLVKSFNTIFGGNNIKNEKSVFMKKEDENQTPKYEAEYLKVEYDSSKIDDEKNRIHIAMLKKNEETSDDDIASIEASYVAKKIQEIVKKQYKDQKTGELKNYKYSDIAILFKATSNLVQYESEFLKAHIPYSTEIYKGFFSDGPINDIVSFLKICVYPNDSNSYAKLLCSPFVNLTRNQAELFCATITQKQTETEKYERIYPFDENSIQIATELFGEESIPLKNLLEAKQKFDEIKNLLHREKISKIITKLWYNFGYRYETLWNQDVQMFSSLYDIIFELARKSEENTQSIASFLDELEKYNNNISKIEGLDIPLEANDSVKIMTIHKSKGLEFPIVFVCSAGKKSKELESSVEFSREFGLILKTPLSELSQKVKTKAKSDGIELDFVIKDKVKTINYFINTDSALDEPEDCAELRRLTYVAFTRAIDELYIVGSYDRYYKGILDTSTVPKLPKTIFASIENVVNNYTETKEVKIVDKSKNQETDKSKNEIIEFERIAKKDAPFTFEEFHTKFEYENSDSINENSIEHKENFANAIRENYENATIIEKDYIFPTHISPSSLEYRRRSEQNQAIPMQEIDEIIDSTIFGKENILEWYKKWNSENPDNQKEPKLPRPKFGYNDFGTIAHAYMEEKINSIIENREFEVKIPEKLWLGLDVDSKQKKSGEALSENRIRIQEICTKMADDFSKTELFKEICNSDWKKTEYSFKVSLKGKIPLRHDVIVNGMMDLAFKNSNPNAKYKYTIVDYKTDKLQTPERYFSQLASYKMAISQMKGVNFDEVGCILYFLRYGKDAQIDVTEYCTLDKLGMAMNSVLKNDAIKFGTNKENENPYEETYFDDDDELGKLDVEDDEYVFDTDLDENEK